MNIDFFPSLKYICSAQKLFFTLQKNGFSMHRSLNYLSSVCVCVCKKTLIQINAVYATPVL